eukprot:TRINITY_DN661_c0_g1_i1.p1 TRINITY_DN661_c0_g1~~TRINITY_DN661_c0_g1_i1.p1  ORF type:complete len:571 (+),score=157.97 TRINITY_DN661_c0_g1_i1:53-1765(+)
MAAAAVGQFCLYELLGLQFGGGGAGDAAAADEVIKRAYKQMARKWHPDKNPAAMAAVANQQFQLIQEAYDVLREQARRTAYHSFLCSKHILPSYPTQFEFIEAFKSYEKFCYSSNNNNNGDGNNDVATRRRFQEFNNEVFDDDDSEDEKQDTNFSIDDYFSCAFATKTIDELLREDPNYQHQLDDAMNRAFEPEDFYDSKRSGFYGVHSMVFQEVADLEFPAEKIDLFPSFGDSNSLKRDVLNFYKCWSRFRTCRSFEWIYEQFGELLSSSTVAEEETRKKIRELRKAYDNRIRSFVLHVRSLDPRVAKNRIYSDRSGFEEDFVEREVQLNEEKRDIILETQEEEGVDVQVEEDDDEKNNINTSGRQEAAGRFVPASKGARLYLRLQRIEFIRRREGLSRFFQKVLLKDDVAGVFIHEVDGDVLDQQRHNANEHSMPSRDDKKKRSFFRIRTLRFSLRRSRSQQLPAPRGNISSEDEKEGQPHAENVNNDNNLSSQDPEDSVPLTRKSLFLLVFRIRRRKKPQVNLSDEEAAVGADQNDNHNNKPIWWKKHARKEGFGFSSPNLFDSVKP